MAASKKGGGIINAMWERIKANDRLHMGWCVFGVVGCLMLYGVLQVGGASRLPARNTFKQHPQRLKMLGWCRSGS